MNDTVPHLLTIPDSLLLEEIFPQLPLSYLSQLCSINTRFRNICLNDRLWELRTYYYYPNKINQKPTEISWRQYYMDLTSVIRQVKVRVNPSRNNFVYLGEIDLTHNSTIPSLTNEIVNLAQQKGYIVNDFIIDFNQSVPYDYIAYSRPNNFKTFGPIKNINLSMLILYPGEINLRATYGNI